MSYKKKTITGISWMSIFRIATRAVVLVKLAVVARILTPSQFGVFGIASLVLSLLEVLTETGINTILIQSKEKIDKNINTIWVVSILRGFFIGIILILTSPLIAIFFNNYDVVGVLILISFLPILRGFVNPAVVSLQKELNFRKEFYFRISIFIIDAFFSTLLVILMRSIYGLVVGSIFGVLAELLFSFVLFRMRPKFSIKKDQIYSILRKSKWVTAYSIFNYLGQEADDIFVGKILGSQNLGLYQMAFKISLLPISEISDVVSKVIFPVFSQLSNQRDRLLRAYYKTVLITSFASIFFGSLIIVFSYDIVYLVLGEEWIEAVAVLRVLSLYGILRTISGPTSALFLARSKQNYVAAMTFVRLIVLLITIYPSIKFFGLLGAGISILLSVIIELPLMIFLTYRIFNDKKK